MNRNHPPGWASLGLGIFCLLAANWPASASFWSSEIETAPTWGVFEHTFKSSADYASPLEDVTLKVMFTSPLGDTKTVYGFWDGGKTWRVRFSPDFPGRWTFQTACSDAANGRLNNVSGEFNCTSAAEHSVFDRRGRVQMARDHRHLEYGNGTPYFWLSDAVWDGALQTTPDQWNYYAQVRARQNFTVAEWVASPGTNTDLEAAFTGTDHVKINLRAFKQLDAKVAALNRAGILDAIVPFGEMSPQGNRATKAMLDSLPESQAILLVRYMVARWDANDVAWMLACDGSTAARWARIGRAVFGEVSHSPVIVNPGDAYWSLESFSGEPWVDILGYQTGQDVSDNNLQWLLSGPVSKDWLKEPARAFINLTPPCENELSGASRTRVPPSAIRRLACWSLLTTAPAGIGYTAHGVRDWEMDVDTNTVAAGLPPLTAWQKSLFLPGAKQMGVLAGIFNSIDFGRLRPAPQLLATQPGAKAPGNFIAAAATDFGDLALIYLPDGGEVELNTKALPQMPELTWINPRTGVRTPTSLTHSGVTLGLTAPAPGDWLLLIKTTRTKFYHNGN